MNDNFDIIYVADSKEEYQKLKNKISKINFKKTFDNVSDLYLNQFVLYIHNKTNLNIQLLKKKYFFQKKKWIMNDFKLISSFSFDNSKIIIKDKSYINLESKKIIKEKFEQLKDYSFYTKKKKWNLFNKDLFYSYDTISKYKFNLMDLSWHIILIDLILCHSGYNNSIHLELIESKDFQMKHRNNIFFYNLKNSYLLNKYFNFLDIKCDYCAQDIKSDYIYSNSDLGEICPICFNKKQKNEILKREKILLNFKNIIKKIIFKKKLEKTKSFLKFYSIKECNLNTKYNLLLNAYRSKKIPYCAICLCPLRYDIASGNCGHCFHNDCLEFLIEKNDIDYINTVKCPTCRKRSKFHKIFLDFN